MKLKTVRIPRGYDGLHLEIPGAVVNVRVGLHDQKGNEVTHISIAPDRQCGDEWITDWGSSNGLTGGGCRLVQAKRKR